MDKKKFKISSSLKDLIGKDLITNDNVAIFELVKNSYDAYATKVEITFNEDSIIIADNGKGMTYDDLINKWLFLGYSAKKNGTEDSESDKQKSYRDNINRHYAGAKGIGRFSCDRLGKKLELKTKNESSSKAEKLLINWTDFEKDQSEEFMDVAVQYESLLNIPQFPENKKTGTILTITGLHEGEWNREKILKLKQSLEKLINPFSETEKFSIEIICKNQLVADEEEKNHSGFYDKDIVNGEIENSITEILSLKTTRIDVMLLGDTILTSLSDRDTPIYKIREKNLLYPKLKYVDIHLYFLNRSAKIAFNKIMGVQPVNYGSIFLFRNGFRILPFGNEGDDSWGLDYRAQQGFNRFLGTRDLFGRVDVQTDDVNDLKEVSSRDGGLIYTEVAKQLFDFFTVTHRRLERYVAGVLWGESFLRKEYFNSQKEGELKRKELQTADKDSDNTNYLLKSSVGSKIDFIQLIKTLIKDKNIEVLDYNKDLANIFSSVDNIADIKPQFIDDFEKIAKETKNGDLLFSLDEAKKELLKLKSEKEEAIKRAERAETQRNSAVERANNAEMERNFAELRADRAEKENKELGEKVEQVQKENLFLTSDVNSDVKQLASLQHTITHTSRKIRIAIEDAMEFLKNDDKKGLIESLNRAFLLNQQIETISGLVSKVNYDVKANKITKDFVEFTNEYLMNYCISNYNNIRFHIPKTNVVWKTKFEAIKIIIIIDNLLSNSDKFETKNIYIDWLEKTNVIDFIYRDDGEGIAADILPEIFDYRFTTTDGGGLGLYHIKSIMEDDFSGTVEVKSEKGKGTEFILHFPKRV